MKEKERSSHESSKKNKVESKEIIHVGIGNTIREDKRKRSATDSGSTPREKGRGEGVRVCVVFGGGGG